MSNDIYASQLKDVKIRLLNFVRTNSGYTPDQVSRTLSIPLNVVHLAVNQLKQEGLLQQLPTLKIGRRQS